MLENPSSGAWEINIRILEKTLPGSHCKVGSICFCRTFLFLIIKVKGFVKIVPTLQKVVNSSTFIPVAPQGKTNNQNKEL